MSDMDRVPCTMDCPEIPAGAMARLSQQSSIPLKSLRTTPSLLSSCKPLFQVYIYIYIIVYSIVTNTSTTLTTSLGAPRITDSSWPYGTV